MRTVARLALIGCASLLALMVCTVAVVAWGIHRLAARLSTEPMRGT